jgi:hypothetical protein
MSQLCNYMNPFAIAVVVSMLTVSTIVSLSADISGGSLLASTPSNDAINYSSPNFTFEYPSNWTIRKV